MIYHGFPSCPLSCLALRKYVLCYSGEECGPQCDSSPGIPSYCSTVKLVFTKNEADVWCI